MIYVSYFNSRLVRLSRRKKYSIALKAFTPIESATELLLRPADFFKYRNNTINLDELKKLYRLNVLDKLEPNSIKTLYDECILLCHEVEGCHREELLTWLNENNIAASEYGGE